eukprot:gene14800-16442_t
MFGKLAASVGDAVGTGQGDNCRILSPTQFANEKLLLTYILPEEKIFVILKSPREEYIFTDRGLITVRGNSSIGTKKSVERYDYCQHRVSRVRIQSPGLAGTDYDGELFFQLGGGTISIDIRRDEWEGVKPIYRTLVKLQDRQFREATAYHLFQETLSKAWLQNGDAKVIKDLAVASDAAVERYFPVSYIDIWEQHSKDNEATRV